MFTIKFLFLIGISIAFEQLPLAHAQTRSQVYGDDLTKQAQTVYLSATSSMTSFESQAAGSTETQGSNVFEIGGWFGEARLAGLKISSSRVSIPFSITQSSSQQAFTDVRMTMRLLWFTPSIGVSVSEVDVQQAGIKTVGLFRTGINAGLGLNVGVYKGVVVSADAMTVRSDRVYDKLAQDGKLGKRDEIDGRISFDLTERIVDLIIGYRMQRYDISTASQIFTEQNQGAYAGLRLGVYF